MHSLNQFNCSSSSQAYFSVIWMLAMGLIPTTRAIKSYVSLLQRSPPTELGSVHPELNLRPPPCGEMPHVGEYALTGISTPCPLQRDVHGKPMLQAVLTLGDRTPESLCFHNADCH
ncbi:hypothetical protein BDZ89DRAFT_653988 [Hymenopellis radicata]|nr:hypothetical protein BDZ89DRAFT_653988 [Hymenopellis radicata]